MTPEADDPLGRMVCCPTLARSHEKPWRDLIAVDGQEVVVLQTLSWKKTCLGFGEDGEVHEYCKLLKPHFSEASFHFY